jgi:carboxymethylenebutenolidase
VGECRLVGCAAPGFSAHSGWAAAGRRSVDRARGEASRRGRAVADSDRSCTPEHQGALAAALAAADVEYCIELYRGKKHGFAVPDNAGAYDRDAADRHWRRLETFFGETLA